MTIRAVVFDVGETLVDETQHWGEWAEVLDVTRLTFFAALGAVIAEGQHHREVFKKLGTTHEAALALRAALGVPPMALTLEQFYPDALPCLHDCQSKGLRVGIAGNQPERTEDALRGMGLQFDLLASSARWGLEKPAPEFFIRIAQELKLPPQDIAYVGDRVDNDVVPAAQLGMVAVFLKRGPWGYLQAAHAGVSQARLKLETLQGLADALLALK